MTTTAPRAIPRCPQRSRNALSASPSRVPPDQSGTASPAAIEGSLGVALPHRAGHLGEPGADGEDLDAGAARRWSARAASRRRLSAYGLIEPETSTSSTTRRDRVPRRRHCAGGPAPPSGCSCRAQGATGVDLAARCRSRRREARRRGSGRRSEPKRRGQGGLLGGRQSGDVAVPQHLGRAGGRPQQLGVAIAVPLAAPSLAPARPAGPARALRRDGRLVRADRCR